MKPEFRENWKCPLCKKEGVGIELSDFSASITWCANGHVVVYDIKRKTLPSLKIYDFETHKAGFR